MGYVRALRVLKRLAECNLHKLHMHAAVASELRPFIVLTRAEQNNRCSREWGTASHRTDMIVAFDTADSHSSNTAGYSRS